MQITNKLMKHSATLPPHGLIPGQKAFHKQNKRLGDNGWRSSPLSSVLPIRTYCRDSQPNQAPNWPLSLTTSPRPLCSSSQLPLPQTSCGRTLAGNRTRLRLPTDQQVDEHYYKLHQNGHDGHDRHRATDEFELMVMAENSECRVSQPHKNKRQCQDDGKIEPFLSSGRRREMKSCQSRYQKQSNIRNDKEHNPNFGAGLGGVNASGGDTACAADYA